LKTPRLLRLLRVARRIDQYSEYGASVLVLMMAAFTLFAHWLACGFYALASYERRAFHLDDGVGYLNELADLTGMRFADNATAAAAAPVGGPDVRSCYITSLYFTFTILTSVGFGNVAPVTDVEKVFSVFAMILGCECGRRRGGLRPAEVWAHVDSTAVFMRLYFSKYLIDFRNYFTVRNGTEICNNTITDDPTTPQVHVSLHYLVKCHLNGANCRSISLIYCFYCRL